MDLDDLHPGGKKGLDSVFDFKGQRLDGQRNQIARGPPANGKGTGWPACMGPVMSLKDEFDVLMLIIIYDNVLSLP